MNTRKAHNLPAGLEGVRQRFDRRRRTHRTRSRIPDSLWAAAVKLVGTYGLHRTSRALHLDYYSLKRRVEQRSTAASDLPEAATAATFLELAPVADRCECMVELEDAAGAKMRVHLKGAPMPDLMALSRSFWNPSP